jgi:hypothetical protein
LIEERNALLAKFQTLAELHRNDMVAIHDEYKEEIALLKSNNTLLREKLESINH